MKIFGSIFFMLWITFTYAQEVTDYSPADSTGVEQDTEIVSKSEENQEREDYQHERKHKKQEIQTLSGSLDHSGGYGALLFKSSELLEKTIIMTGIRGAWVLNRSFGIGLEVTGIIPVAKFDGIDPEGEHMAILLGGYGGFFVEPIFWSNKALHITFPVSAGSGWLGYIEDWDDNNYTYNYEDNLYDDDLFWYVEPGVVIELNVSRSFRLNFGVSKRFTEDLVLLGTDPGEFENMNYTFTMKFGYF
ncbi:hypothetical protein ACFLU5_04785 [Bacteroidota bacterium]